MPWREALSPFLTTTVDPNQCLSPSQQQHKVVTSKPSVPGSVGTLSSYKEGHPVPDDSLDSTVLLPQRGAPLFLRPPSDPQSCPQPVLGSCSQAKAPGCPGWCLQHCFEPLCQPQLPPARAGTGLSTRHRICPTWNIHGGIRMERGRPGHFVLQHGWHWCTSCLSLTNLPGSAAVQSVPLPAAEIWRGVWRCLAQSQGVEPIGTSTWLAASGRRNQNHPPPTHTHTLLLRKPALSTPSLTASAPQTMSFLQCLSSPGAPWWVGRPRSSPTLPAAPGWRRRGEGAPSPALLLAREDIWLLWHLVLPAGPPAAAVATPL